MPARSIADLPDVSFATFADFQDAHARGGTLIWIRSDFRSVWEVSGGYGRAFHLLFTGFPLYAAAAFVWFALRTHHYGLLLGVPAALAGFACASPNVNMIQGCLPFAMMLAGCAASLFAGESYALVGFAAVASWIAASVGQASAHLAVEQAIAKSEDTLVRLCDRKVVTDVRYARHPLRQQQEGER